MRTIIGTLLLCLLLSGCAFFRSAALGVASPMLKDAIDGIEQEKNWSHFEKATAANISLLDGLLAIRPYDESLLMAAIKANAGYAFGVMETLYLEDKINDEEESYYKDQAIYYYSKAFDYGLAYLRENDLSFKDIQKAMRDREGVPGLLEAQLSGDEISLNAILFTAQALGSMINLQRDNMILVSKLPVAKGMFDWVCELAPDIGHGVCKIFYASYEASRPAMLGGKPELGRKLFEDYIKNKPHNWLIRVSFIEHYAAPLGKEDVFKKQMDKLEVYSKWHKERLSWRPGEKTREAFLEKSLGLYQAIAIKRYEIIKKYEDEII